MEIEGQDSELSQVMMPLMRNSRLTFRLARLLMIVLVPSGALLAAACSREDSRPSELRFWPDPAVAKRALVASLDAWRRGAPQETISDRTPSVESWDSSRKDGRELASYELVGQVGSGDERIFAVKLRLDNPPEDQMARYLVRGIDPIWVFRWEDYERISHWEHDMTETQTLLQQKDVSYHHDPWRSDIDREVSRSPSSIYRATIYRATENQDASPERVGHGESHIEEK